ncbi:hypothetical protein ACFSHQ_05420 [Gemmobacter lanyuensis]
MLKAGFANETGVLTLDLTATEGAEGIATTLMGLPGAPAVDLTIKGEGRWRIMRRTCGSPRTGLSGW